MNDRNTYYVVLHQGNWKIDFQGQHYGPYTNQNDAIKKAVDAAHESSKNGHLSQVKVQGTNNQFRTEWTYGKDPYPPKG